MTPLDRIQEKLPFFTKTEQCIANYILKNSHQFVNQSIDETVALLNVSKPAMIRFAKKLNYNGYSQFKFDLSYYLMSNTCDNSQYETTSSLHGIISTLSSYLNQLEHCTDAKELKEIAELIKKSNKRKIFAYHKPSLSASMLKMNSLKLGLDMDVLNDPVAMLDSIHFLNKDDVVIIYTIDDIKNIYSTIIQNLNSASIPVIVINVGSNVSAYHQATHCITLPSLFDRNGYFIEEQMVFIIYNQLLIQSLIEVTHP